MLVNSQLVCLPPVGILNQVMFIYHYLFTLVLKSPDGEWPITYTFTHFTFTFTWRERRSRDLFYVITSTVSILVGHSRQILSEAISTTVIILTLTAIVCHLGGPFSVVFPKIKTINYSHVTHFIRFYWSYNIKVVEIS